MQSLIVALKIDIVNASLINFNQMVYNVGYKNVVDLG